MKKLLIILTITILFFSCAWRTDTKYFEENLIQIQKKTDSNHNYYQISADIDSSEYESLSWHLFQLKKKGNLLHPSFKEINYADKIFLADITGVLNFITFSAHTDSGKVIFNIPINLNSLTPPSEGNKYLTLSNPDDLAVIPVSIQRIQAKLPENAVLEYQDGDYSFYKFYNPGYFHFNLNSNSTDNFYYNVFVSPVESIHTERADVDWYFTQFKTTTTSNCGPTVVSMGVAWASGKSVPVGDIRKYVGWKGNGGINFLKMQEALIHHNVESELVDFESKEQIFEMIDNDILVGILYNMKGIKFQPLPEDSFFDQYYVDSGGHYLAIKGYTTDKKYFIIYDPIPSDWSENKDRYGDELSMYGRNRYYHVDELEKSLMKNQLLLMFRTE